MNTVTTTTDTDTEQLWPADFNLHSDHCGDVLRGCYDMAMEPSVILDIGANVGAFARWASSRWPKATIHCYEPQPDNFKRLTKTVGIYNLTNVHLNETAVGESANAKTLFENGLNCGEWSMIKFTKEGSGQVQVKVRDASTLPDADFIKIDTEGFELPILKRMADHGRLAKTKAVVLEYHAAPHVAVIISILQQSGLMLAHVHPVSDHRGLMKFVRP